MAQQNVLLSTNSGIPVSLQVSKMGSFETMAPNQFNPGQFFLLKNNGEDPITITGTLAGDVDDTSLTTTIFTGWNPELWKKIWWIGGDYTKLQYGY